MTFNSNYQCEPDHKIRELLSRTGGRAKVNEHETLRQSREMTRRK
jgi:hypothetical protein